MSSLKTLCLVSLNKCQKKFIKSYVNGMSHPNWVTFCLWEAGLTWYLRNSTTRLGTVSTDDMRLLQILLIALVHTRAEYSWTEYEDGAHGSLEGDVLNWAVLIQNYILQVRSILFTFHYSSCIPLIIYYQVIETIGLFDYNIYVTNCLISCLKTTVLFCDTQH